MHSVAIPVHRLAEEALQSLEGSAIARGIKLLILADPELSRWIAPYPEPVHELFQRLGQQLIDICPPGEMLIMIEKADYQRDTIRLEVQFDIDNPIDDVNDLPMAILETDNVSSDINLLGMDSPEDHRFVFGYEVSVPLIREDRKATPAQPLANDAHEQSPLLNVLVVDDNAVNRLVVSKFLTRWGMHVDHAHDGEGAIQQTHHSKYDLILMDLEMPVMDGFEATREIRSLERNLEMDMTPVIALTAYTQQETKEKAFASGMNDFMTKPLDPPQLYQKILRHTLGQQLETTMA